MVALVVLAFSGYRAHKRYRELDARPMTAFHAHRARAVLIWGTKSGLETGAYVYLCILLMVFALAQEATGSSDVQRVTAPGSLIILGLVVMGVSVGSWLLQSLVWLARRTISARRAASCDESTNGMDARS